jgi:hypothetical protein
MTTPGNSLETSYELGPYMGLSKEPPYVAYLALFLPGVVLSLSIQNPIPTRTKRTARPSQIPSKRKPVELGFGI